jgi:mono/diheme cytochrome c family protein
MLRKAMAGAVLFAMMPAIACAADVLRGQSIYETRCIVCHDKSVHQREARKAKDFAGLREQVLRWSREVGGAWSEGEIDDIALYLNNRFYFFRCPPSVCGNSQAQIDTRSGIRDRQDRRD